MALFKPSITFANSWIRKNTTNRFLQFGLSFRTYHALCKRPLTCGGTSQPTRYQTWKSMAIHCFHTFTRKSKQCTSTTSRCWPLWTRRVWLHGWPMSLIWFTTASISRLNLRIWWFRVNGSIMTLRSKTIRISTYLVRLKLWLLWTILALGKYCRKAHYILSLYSSFGRMNPWILLYFRR